MARACPQNALSDGPMWGCFDIVVKFGFLMIFGLSSSTLKQDTLWRKLVWNVEDTDAGLPSSELSEEDEEDEHGSGVCYTCPRTNPQKVLCPTRKPSHQLH